MGNKAILILWLAACALVLLWVAESEAFTLQIKNTTETTKIFTLYWVDHPYKAHPGPINVVSAEMKPGEVFLPHYDRPSGRYIITWSDLGENTYYMKLTTHDRVIRVEVTPYAVTKVVE